MKTCSKCQRSKDPSEFRVIGGKPFSYCHPCSKKYDNERYRLKRSLRKKQIKANAQRSTLQIRALKEGRPCMDCGGVFHFAAMQWDHRPGEEKLGQVSVIAAQGCVKKALAEIAKCDLVCANCHAIRTYTRSH